jgi:hypothetical protein
MHNRVERKLQNCRGTEALPRLRLLRLVHTSSVAGTTPAVTTRNGLDIHGSQELKVWSLSELEAENAELRKTAIQLALEIQDLRMLAAS